MKKKAARVSDLLDEVLSSQGLRSVSWLVRLSSKWPEIVGPLLSGKTAPVRFRNGVLTVLVQNHSWAQELQLRKPDLLGWINAAVEGGKADDIRFAVGPLHEADAEETKAPVPSADLQPVVEPEGIASVADPETRDILRSVARKSALRKR